MRSKANPNNRIQQKRSLRFRLKVVVIGAVLTGFVALVTLFVLNFGKSEPAKAATTIETMSAGSFIINMGITPQTVSNGLKAYGCVYDLIANYQVPVKWVIEPAKTKDGTDFTYNSVNYRGGPFIIQKEVLTPAIAARISYWQTQGMQGLYTTSAITVPVYMTITDFPNVMIDTLSSLQSIIINYYNNAGIPSTAYSLGNPSGLNQCHDLWTNPHGDPTWASHSYLYNFVTVQKSFIWAECHSVSMMESCTNPSPPNQKLNFLTSNGLKCWQSGSCGTIPETHVLSASSPYSYFHPDEPVMQFMGNMELCTQVGSERWYIPLTTGGWNATAKRGVTTGSVPSPGEGVLLVFGHAYGNPANGMVMYEAGHDLTGGGGGAAQPHKVSAQRAYFNFALLAGRARRLNITASFPSAVSQGQSYPVSASTISGTPSFSYQWTSSMGGSFANSTDSSTTYTAPVITKDTVDIIRVKVTDQCGKISFEYSIIPLKVNPLPVNLLSFQAEVIEDTIYARWITASEVNNSHFTLFRSNDGQVYFELARIKGNGTTSVQHTYEHPDRIAPNGINYYRLSQTDYDGTIKVYDPIAVMKNSHGEANYQVSIFPNPFRKNFSVSFVSKDSQLVVVSIHNLKGAMLDQKEFAGKKGPNQFDYASELNIPPGIYLVGIKPESGNTQFIKVIRQ